MDAINNNGNTLSELLALLITSETSDEGRARVAAEFADLNLTAEAHGDRVLIVIGGACGLRLDEYEVTIRKTTRAYPEECENNECTGCDWCDSQPDAPAVTEPPFDGA